MLVNGKPWPMQGLFRSASYCLTQGFALGMRSRALNLHSSRISFCFTPRAQLTFDDCVENAGGTAQSS
ncbi:hypothetical protein BH10ACI4_BH10ACI4_29530 [soil metagenome]